MRNPLAKHRIIEASTIAIEMHPMVRDAMLTLKAVYLGKAAKVLTLVTVTQLCTVVAGIRDFACLCVDVHHDCFGIAPLRGCAA